MKENKRRRVTFPSATENEPETVMKDYSISKMDDYRLMLAGRELVPIMQGGMGVNISTKAMALAIAHAGGIGHVSDAMLPDLADRLFKTGFTKIKTKLCRAVNKMTGYAGFEFPIEDVRWAAKTYLGDVMAGKKGPGLVFVNVMEKLTMNDSSATLKARLLGALDAGIDGISLSAGLHTSSFAMMEEHPRFRDAMLGIVVSSSRALNLFLRCSARTGRLPDYIVVEGPLAGGHLGFGLDTWQSTNLFDIVKEVKAYLSEKALSIPVLAAGGIFTGTDGVRLMDAGAAGIQVATRFTVTKESGLPDAVKDRYFEAQTKDVVVNGISPTGYPMRMLTASPAIGASLKPQCVAYGYMLAKGECSYLKEYEEAVAQGRLHKGICRKTCLCSQMRNYKLWTVGTTADRLKETSVKDRNGHWLYPTTREIFDDYRYGVNDEVKARSRID